MPFLIGKKSRLSFIERLQELVFPIADINVLPGIKVHLFEPKCTDWMDCMSESCKEKKPVQTGNAYIRSTLRVRGERQLRDVDLAI